MTFKIKDMKNRISKYVLLLAIACGLLASCVDRKARNNDFDAPNIPPLPVGTLYSVRNLLDIFSENGNRPVKITDTASVCAIVTADETSGNLYKAAFISDGTASIELYMESTSGLRIGDSIRVYLNGATVSEYSGTPQIQDLDPNNITILKNGCEVNVTELSISDMNEFDNHICELVKFDEVEFVEADLNKPYADSAGYGSRIINDCEGTSQVTVRTSNYASFAKQTIPSGNGSITGILTKYKSGSNVTWQLVLRSPSEVVFDNARCFGTGDGTEENPYDVRALQSHQGENGKWAHGYIVGSSKSRDIQSAEDIVWTAPFDEELNLSNVIIADNPDEKNIERCAIVYLPSNTNIRETVNLHTHPENLGKKLNVNGDLSIMYNMEGTKAVYDGQFHLGE